MTGSNSRWIRLGARLLPAAYRTEILGDLLEERKAMIDGGRGRLSAAVWMLAHLVRSAVASRRQTARGRRSLLRGIAIGRELRQAARSLRKAPWYAVTIVAVTALSMALATTVFAVVDGVLFKPLPYPNPDELFVVTGRFDGSVEPSGSGIERVSADELASWSALVPDAVFTGYTSTSVQFPDGGHARAVAVERRFPEVFGLRLLMGGFREEHFDSEMPVWPVVISHRLWQERFAGNPQVVGTVVKPMFPLFPPFQVVGVLAPGGFVPPWPDDAPTDERREDRIDVLIPLAGDFHTPSYRGLVGFARLPPGRLIEAATQIRSAIRASYEATAPLPPDLSPFQRRRRAPFASVDLVPLAEYTSSRERPAFALAFGTVMSLVCLVLLNAAALTVARAHQRMQDFSLRRALGARTRDLLRHALAEQGLLVVAGATAGLVASPLLLALVLERLPPGVNLIKDVSVDWRVMTFAALLSALAAVTVAWVSVHVATRRAGVTHPLLAGPGGVTARARLGRLLLAAQAAVAFALVLGGALFSTSLARIWAEDPGLTFRNTTMMTLAYAELDDRVRRANALALATRLRGTTGIANAGLLDASVMENFEGEMAVRPPTGALPDAPRPLSVNVSGGFFDAAGVTLLAGRLPSDTELDTGAPVLVVSETVARAFWPGQSAIGQTLRPFNVVDCTVVGIVRDVRMVAMDLPSTGVVFVPWSLKIPHPNGSRLLVRLEDGAALPAVTERIRQLDPDVRLLDVRMLEDAASESIRERRLSALSASVFGGVALVFVTVGILGLVAMTASRRTREVGIRMALGARPGGVVRQLIGEQLGAVIAGMVAGGLMAAWAVRFIQGHLYETAGHDPAVWATTVAVMLVTTTLGAWIPAMRASRIDPVEALREN